MNQDVLFDTVPCNKIDLMSRDDLANAFQLEQELRLSLQRKVDKLMGLLDKSEQKSLFVNEQYIALKNKIFGRSSEKEKSSGKTKGKPKEPKKRVQLPSKRYPNAPIIEQDVELEELPNCDSCGHQMKDSGMTEDSEFLTVVPAIYLVIRQKRHKYKCGHCHGCLKTAPAPPRITPGSCYSDEMILDAALSKYCDLIPLERYAEIAGRNGLEGLPANSLIGQTHHLANFVIQAYLKVREEVRDSEIAHADETPHKMLEGDKNKNWYLWGFSTESASYFEIHDTRSGGVASSMLKDSNCKYLVSDVYSGYAKSVRESNEWRRKENREEIISIYCNAHSRRKFKDSKINYPESDFFLRCYQKIYELRDEDCKVSEDLKLPWQNCYMRLMERRAILLKNSYSSKSSLGKALNYFVNNFEGLSLFSKVKGLPVDNNSQERLLRSPVVGRKTWDGTHSKRGAKTAAILFTLVESCKLNGLNPREYFKDLVASLHRGEDAFTPREYKGRREQNSAKIDTN